MARKRQTTALPKATPKKPEVTENTEPPSFQDRILNREPNREYKSRAEREAEIQRIVLLTVGVAVVAIIFFLLVGFVVDVLIRPNQAVATVAGTNISAAQFRERVRIERAFNIYQLNESLNDFVGLTGSDPNTAFSQLLGQNPYQTWYNELEVPDQIGVRVLDDLIHDEIVRDYAEANNIAVTDEDVNAKINEFISYDPERVAAIGTEPTATPSPTVTPTPLVSPTPSPTVETPEVTPEPTTEVAAGATEDATAEVVDGATPTYTPVSTSAPATLTREEVEQNFTDERQAMLQTIASDANVSQDRIREHFRLLALRDKVAESLAGNSTTTTYANARHILVVTLEEAEDIVRALEEGESFAELARTVSTDEGSGANGGELGWTPLYNFVKPFADAVREAPIGETVGPVESEFGYHVIQVTAREERDVEEEELNRARQVVLNNWLEEQAEPEVTPNETFNNWTEFVPQNPVFVYRPR